MNDILGKMMTVSQQLKVIDETLLCTQMEEQEDKKQESKHMLLYLQPPHFTNSTT